MYTPYKFTMPCTGISVPHSSMISLTMALLQNCVNHLVEAQGPLGSSLNASLPRRHVTLKSRPKVRAEAQGNLRLALLKCSLFLFLKARQI